MLIRRLLLMWLIQKHYILMPSLWKYCITSFQYITSDIFDLIQTSNAYPRKLDFSHLLKVNIYWHDTEEHTHKHKHVCVSLLVSIYFAHHGLDIDRSWGSSSLGLFLLLLLPEDDGMDARASVLSILLQLGRTRVETEIFDGQASFLCDR